MFCSNCGMRVDEGAKFCSNCGGKLVWNTTTYEDERKTDTWNVDDEDKEIDEWDEENEEDYPPYDENKNYCLEEIMILFHDAFKDSRHDYSYRVMFPTLVTGYHILQIEQEQIKRFVSGYPNEEILMIVKNGLDIVLLLTNYWLVFSIDGNGYIATLEELKSLEITKTTTLTRTIELVFNDGMSSPPIELDPSISYVDRFLSNFKCFIEAVHDLFQRNIENEKRKTEEAEHLEKIKAREKARLEEVKNSIDPDLAKTVMNMVNDAACKLSISVERGNPLTSYSEKYAKAKNCFEIPDFEDIYLIYDATIWGGCSRGFAICASGIYYNEKDDSDAQHIPWGAFKKVVIKYNGLT